MTNRNSAIHHSLNLHLRIPRNLIANVFTGLFTILIYKYK